MLRMLFIAITTLTALIVIAVSVVRLHYQAQMSHSQLLLHSRMQEIELHLQRWQKQPSCASSQALATHASHALRSLRNLYQEEARWWDLYLAVEQQLHAQEQYLLETQAHEQRRQDHQRGLEQLDHLLQQTPQHRLQFSLHQHKHGNPPAP